MTKKEKKIGILEKKKFNDLFESYSPVLINYLTSRTGNSSDAKDIAQEAYLRIMRVKDFDLIEKPEAYLFKIAVNVSNEFMLKKAKTSKHQDVNEIDQYEDIQNSTRFEDDIEARSAIKELDRVLEKLPPLYRKILLLRKRDGYSYAEIAEKLNISPNTVHQYMTRALAKCRSEWAE